MQQRAASTSGRTAGNPPALPRVICSGASSAVRPACGPRAWSTQVRTLVISALASSCILG
eukprot:12291223-Alexandrium_andersonii.AAC.1